MCVFYNCKENYGQCQGCHLEKRLEELTDSGYCSDCLKKPDELEIEEELPEIEINEYD